MEKAKLEKIKDIFLATFMLMCVGLIITLWVNAFAEKDSEMPYFYRGVPTLSEQYYVTQTAIAEDALLGTGTPTVEPKQHHDATAIPTVIPTAAPVFTPTTEVDS
jgi:hypothetical protein